MGELGQPTDYRDTGDQRDPIGRAVKDEVEEGVRGGTGEAEDKPEERELKPET